MFGKLNGKHSIFRFHRPPWSIISLWIFVCLFILFYLRYDHNRIHSFDKIVILLISIHTDRHQQASSIIMITIVSLFDLSLYISHANIHIYSCIVNLNANLLFFFFIRPTIFQITCLLLDCQKFSKKNASSLIQMANRSNEFVFEIEKKHRNAFP